MQKTTKFQTSLICISDLFTFRMCQFGFFWVFLIILCVICIFVPSTSIVFCADAGEMCNGAQGMFVRQLRFGFLICCRGLGRCPHDDHTSQKPPGGAEEVSGVGQELKGVSCCSGLDSQTEPQRLAAHTADEFVQPKFARDSPQHLFKRDKL